MHHHVLKLKTQTTLKNFERSFRSSRCYVKGGWQTLQLTLDLSEVEFIDVGVLIRLGSLLEDFRRQGGSLSICLPSEQGLDRFDEKVASLKKKRRRDLNRFCEDFGLFTTIVEAGFPIMDGMTYRPSSGSLKLKDDQAIPRLVPLRWLTTEKFLVIREEWFARIVSQISQGGRYLPKGLADSLSHSFFEELLENVEEHAYYTVSSYAEIEASSPKGLGGGIIHSYGFSHRSKPNYGMQGTQRYLDTLSDGRPVVRLMVSDSGVGIPNSIRDRFSMYPGKSEFEKISKNIQIQQIHFAISMFGSRHSDEEIDRNPNKAKLRGLARLEGFIKIHNCLLYIRSGNVATGFYYEGEEKEYFEATNLPYIPGTSVELILPAESRKRAKINFDSNPLVPEFEYHLLPFDPRSDWLGTLKNRLDSLDRGASVVFLMPTAWGLSGSKTSILFEDILTLREPGFNLCLMVPYQDSKSILHLVPLRNDRETEDCILIGTSDGTYLVYGGSRELQQSCQELLNQGPSLEEVGQSDKSWLRWLSRNSGDASLLYGELLRRTQQYLHEKIDYSSTTLLPSLSYSFIDQAYVENHQRLTAPLCSFFFSSNIPVEEPQVLFYEDGFPIEIVNAVARRCHSKISKVKLSLDNVRKNFIDGIAPGSSRSCAFFTTLIRSGYTVSSCLKYLVRHGYSPKVCFSIYDNRLDQKTLIAYHLKVPVISLLHIPKEPDEELAVQDSARETEYSARKPLISTKKFFDYAERTRAVFVLGHFRRGGSRHMSLFPPIDWIFEKSTELRSNVVKEVLDWLHGNNDKYVDIFVPETDVNYATGIAEATKSRLNEEAITVGLSKLKDSPILKKRTANSAIFLDWGAVKSYTIRRAIIRISDAGYEKIKVIVLTSQMRHEYEDELFRLQNVWGYPSVQHINSPISCSVEFTVFADMPFPIYHEENCKHCSLRGDLEKLSEVEDRQLSEHIRKKLAIFELTEVNAALKESRDNESIVCFGERLDSAETIKIVRLRASLLQLRNLNQQEEFLECLCSTGDTSSLAKAWIRLIALEPSVVHEFPLDTDLARNRLSEMCIALLQETTSGGINWAASAALRSCSKILFIQRFSKLLAEHRNSLDVSGELLVGLWSYLQRPYHQNRESMTNVIRATVDAFSELNSTGEKSNDSLVRSLLYIRDDAELKLRLFEVPNRPKDVISQVNLEYCEHMRAHHPVTTKSEHLVADLDWLQEHFNESTSSARADIADNWEICKSFLKREVNPYFKKVAPIMKDLFTEYGCGELSTNWWDSVIGDFERSIEKLSADILRIVNSEELDAIAVGNTLEDVRNFYKAFLVSSRPAAKEYSYFARQVVYCSSEPLPMFRKVVERVRNKKYEFDLKIINEDAIALKVFCHRWIFEDCMEHLLTNAVGFKHRTESFKRKSVNVELELIFDQGLCVLRLSNNGTKASSPSGTGLRKYSALLKKYEATLKGYSQDEKWSFVTEIKLLAWE